MPSGFQLAQLQAEAYEQFTRTFMEGSAALLAQNAAIGEGDVVLDLACGTGLVARHVVGRVGPDGRVVGVDVNPAMLGIARDRVVGDVDWIEAPCDAIPVDDAMFTHVICQQGFQFFPDPVVAMSEVARILRPGGLVLASVWATPGQNPYIEHQLALLAELDPSVTASVQQATPPDGAEFLRTAARSAGLIEIEVTILEHVAEIVEFEDWFLAQTSGTPWGPALARLSETGRRTLASTMAATVEQFSTPDGVHRIPFRSHVLGARRSTAPTTVPGA